MYGDELTIVYDSYSILKTGMDQTGQRLPLVFEMGEGRLGGYIYASLPFVYFFGLTAFGVRALSLLSGVGIIITIYFLSKTLFKNNNMALLASFIASISPWEIYLSRGGFEAHFALFMCLLGITLFLYKKYIVSAVLFGITIFTYPTFKLTLPLVILMLMVYQGTRDLVKNKTFYLFIFILSFFGVASLSMSFKGLSEARFLSLNIFSDTNVKASIVERVNEARLISPLPESVKQLVFNKPIYYSRLLLDKYMENLSFDFLYLRGDRNPRHNPAEWGMNFLVELPLLFIGFYFLFTKDRRIFYLILSWILITPLATMFMGQTHALRDNLMLPALILISSYAIFNLKSKRLKYLIIFLMLLQLIFILIRVYFYAPYKFGSFWSEKAMTISGFVFKNKNNFEKVVISKKIDNIEYAYPVYVKINPIVVINQNRSKDKEYENVLLTDDLDKYRKLKNYLIIDP